MSVYRQLGLGAFVWVGQSGFKSTDLSSGGARRSSGLVVEWSVPDLFLVGAYWLRRGD